MKRWRFSSLLVAALLLSSGLVAAPGGRWFDWFSSGRASAEGGGLPPQEPTPARPGVVVQVPEGLGFTGPKGPVGSSEVPEWFSKEDKAAKDRGIKADAETRSGKPVGPQANVDGLPVAGVGPTAEGLKNAGGSGLGEEVQIEPGSRGPSKGRRSVKSVASPVAAVADSSPMPSEVVGINGPPTGVQTFQAPPDASTPTSSSVSSTVAPVGGSTTTNTGSVSDVTTTVGGVSGSSTTSSTNPPGGSSTTSTTASTTVPKGPTVALREIRDVKVSRSVPEVGSPGVIVPDSAARSDGTPLGAKRRGNPKAIIVEGDGSVSASLDDGRVIARKASDRRGAISVEVGSESVALRPLSPKNPRLCTKTEGVSHHLGWGAP